jgi:type II secretory pathway pseudopilin PulG
MKAIIKTAVVALALTAASASFAQSQPANASITRAQVRAELVQLEQAGYRPVANDVHYPTNIQNAEAGVTRQQAAAQDEASQSYGCDTAGNSQAGQPGKGSTDQLTAQKPSTTKASRSASHFDQIYFGH